MGRAVKLITHLHLAPTLMNGAVLVHLLPLHAFMARTGKNFTFTSTF